MGFSIKDFASLLSIKEKQSPPALRPVEIKPDGEAPVKYRVHYNPKRMVTFHGRMIRFYKMAIEEAEAIGETDYVSWLQHRLEKEETHRAKCQRYLQKVSFNQTLERFKLD